MIFPQATAGPPWLRRDRPMSEPLPLLRSKPNILLVVLDTHRADRLGLYGAERGTSPNLDAFARSATVFDTAVAPAQWTIPAHASIFTGLAPSAHQVIQAASILDERFSTFAELLGGLGYETAGYCNNPLVGLVQNNLKRGFDKFYNYCGTLPRLPEKNGQGRLGRLGSSLRRLLDPVVDPIQNRFATSNGFLQTAATPLFTPLWTTFVHYKGDTVRSIRDISAALHERGGRPGSQPFLFFLNMMETHLPYVPPREWALRFAPYLRDEPEAAAFLKEFNHHAMRWLIPLKEPFTELQSRVIHDLYDAEVAYQDHELGRLFEELERPALRDNTLVLVVADHGEMLGEHGFMGHGFGVYNELVRVPLMVRLPGQQQGGRVSGPVATRRIFQTVLETAGIAGLENWNGAPLDAREGSLAREIEGQHGSISPVVSEAYAPMDAVKMMERREPELIAPLHTRETHRAVYQEKLKLYDIETVGSRLLGPRDEPVQGETEAGRGEAMLAELARFVAAAREGRPEGWVPPVANLSNSAIEQRLRDLGYMA